MKLQEIREKIQAIDKEIIELIAERISYIPTIVNCKKEQNLPVFQPEREKQLYEQYWQIAVEKKINPELIREVFDRIIFESTRLQEECRKNE